MVGGGCFDCSDEDGVGSEGGGCCGGSADDDDAAGDLIGRCCSRLELASIAAARAPARARVCPTFIAACAAYADVQRLPPFAIPSTT